MEITHITIGIDSFSFFVCLFVCFALEPGLELAHVDQAGIELTEIHPPAFASLVLGLKACTTTV